MTFDYFYGQQADQYSFYRIPKLLITPQFSNVSAEAKLLYGLLLDRMSLSAKNGWMDEKGRVFIIFTIDEIKESICCAEKKAVKLLDELERKCGLIERKRQGLGKPNLIYVKNFISCVDNHVERQFLNCQKDNSGLFQNTTQELSKGQGNNTDINNTEFNDTDPFLSSEEHGWEPERMSKENRYREYFMEQLEYEILYERHPYDRDTLNEILSLLVDTVCTNRKMIRIAGDDKPAEVVKSQFMKLDSEHICYVLDCMNDNTTDVRNPRQYLLAAIYNAPMTINSYYGMKVRHDMSEGKI